MGIAAKLLRTSWRESADRLTRRCDGITDEEYLWSPTADGWNIKPDPERPGRWTYDYDFAPQPPAPITTIGWRLVHVIADNEIYWEYAFGPQQRTFLDLVVPSTVREALQGWHDSRRPITEWLRTATDADLAEPRPSHLGDAKAALDRRRPVLTRIVAGAGATTIALSTVVTLRSRNRVGATA